MIEKEIAETHETRDQDHRGEVQGIETKAAPGIEEGVRNRLNRKDHLLDFGNEKKQGRISHVV